MPGFTVTRGLGGTAASLISRGFISDVRRIFAGASRFTKKIVQDLSQNINISAMLISANGKELARPIFNKVSRVFKSSDTINIKVYPRTLSRRKYKKLKVTAQLRNKDNE